MSYHCSKLPHGMLAKSGTLPSSAKAYPQETHDTDLPLYNTDEFRMYCFKVLPCSKRYCHDWTTCPFAHSAEKAKRRDPRVYTYTGIACPEMKKNMLCPRGDTCPYAHNVFEYWLHPSRYRSQLCNDGTCCKRKVCFFAHAVDELRIPAAKPLSPELAAHLAAQGLPIADDAGENPFLAGPRRGARMHASAATSLDLWGAQQRSAAARAGVFGSSLSPGSGGAMTELAQLILGAAPASNGLNAQTQLLVDHVMSALTQLQLSLPGAITQHNLADVVSALVQQALRNPVLLARQQEAAALEAAHATLLRQAAHAAAPPFSAALPHFPAQTPLVDTPLSLLAAGLLHPTGQLPTAGLPLTGLLHRTASQLSGGEVSPYASSIDSNLMAFSTALFGACSGSVSDEAGSEASGEQQLGGLAQLPLDAAADMAAARAWQ